MKIVALNGAPGAGKSTVANYLIKTHGYTLHKIATPLKNMLRCLGLTEDHIEGHLKEEPCELLGGKSPRWAMQTLGKDWRDMIHPDLWLMAWLNTKPEGNLIVDDLRFPNEVPFFRAQGAKIIRIHRPSHTLRDTGHEAEKQDIPYNSIVTNNGSINELEILIEKVMRHDLGLL
jgi:hypothetical protein